MLGRLSEYHGAVNAVISLGMLLVWVIYLHVVALELP